MSSIVVAQGHFELDAPLVQRFCGRKKVYFTGFNPGYKTRLTVDSVIFVDVLNWNRESVDHLELTCKCETCGAKAFEYIEFKFADNGDEIWKAEVTADWCEYCANKKQHSIPSKDTASSSLPKEN